MINDSYWPMFLWSSGQWGYHKETWQIFVSNALRRARCDIQYWWKGYLSACFLLFSNQDQDWRCALGLSFIGDYNLEEGSVTHLFAQSSLGWVSRVIEMDINHIKRSRKGLFLHASGTSLHLIVAFLSPNTCSIFQRQRNNWRLDISEKYEQVPKVTSDLFAKVGGVMDFNIF